MEPSEEELSLLLESALDHLRAGRADEALQGFEKVVGMAPAHAQAWYCMGTIYSQKEMYQEAVESYANSAHHAPMEQVALPLYNMGVALQAWGKLDKAAECYKLATDADPEMADAWINRGRLLDDAGQHGEAIACYDRSLAAEPDDPVAWCNRGNSLRSLMRFEEAKASYAKALSIDANDAGALVGAGVCEAELGNPLGGLEHIDAGIRIAATPAAFVERANALAKMKRFVDALISIDEGIRRGMLAPEVWNNRGEILAKLARPDDAIKSFDQALLIKPKYLPALFGKARVLCNADRLTEAKAIITLYFQHAGEGDALRGAAQAILAICQ